MFTIISKEMISKKGFKKMKIFSLTRANGELTKNSKPLERPIEIMSLATVEGSEETFATLVEVDGFSLQDSSECYLMHAEVRRFTDPTPELNNQVAEISLKFFRAELYKYQEDAEFGFVEYCSASEGGKSYGKLNEDCDEFIAITFTARGVLDIRVYFPNENEYDGEDVLKIAKLYSEAREFFKQYFPGVE